MRLLMLGHSGVGKTTYMATMYGALQSPVNGFTLRAKDPTLHNRLLGLYMLIRRGYYPEVTDQRTEYEFVLVYDSEGFFEFTWIDYRGGALLSSSDTEEAKALVADLANADGIVLFYDSPKLAPGRRQDRQIGRMTVLLNTAMQQLESPIPLTIVFTKADLVSQLSQESLRPVQNIIDAGAENELIHGRYVFTSCGPSISNVHVPVLHSIHVGTMARVAALEQMSAHNDGEALRHRAAAASFGGLVHDLLSSLVDSPTHYDYAAAHANAAKQQLQAIVPIIEPALQLMELLSEYPEF